MKHVLVAISIALATLAEQTLALHTGEGATNTAAKVRQSAVPQTVALTPQQIDAAIEWGMTGSPRLYRATGGAGNKVVAGFTTPFLRVALAVKYAKDRYKTFTAADVTPELASPVVQVIAYAYEREYIELSTLSKESSLASPQEIIVLPKDSKDAAQATRPLHTQKEPFPWMVSDVLRLFSVSSFPLDVLDPEKEFVFLYDRPVRRDSRELRVRGLCGRFTARGCVPLDKKDPLSQK